MAKWNPKGLELGKIARDTSRSATERMMAMSELCDLSMKGQLALNDDGTEMNLFDVQINAEPQYEERWIRGAKIKVRVK